MLSIRKILPIFLIPLLLVVFISPAEAQRRGGQRRATTRIQRKAPPMRSVQRSAPRQVRRNAPRQIRRSAPRQIRRSAPRQVRRNAPRQVRRSAPRQVRRNAPRQVRRSAPRQVRRNAPRQVRRSAPRQVQRSAPRQVQRSAPRQVQRSAPNRQFSRSRSQVRSGPSQPRYNRQPQQRQMTARPNFNQRPDRQASRGPQRQYNPNPGRRGDKSSQPQFTRRPDRRFDNNSQRGPGRQRQDFNQRPDRQLTRGSRQNRNHFTQLPSKTGANVNRPGRRNPANVQGLAVRRPVQNINTNTNVNVNNTYSQPVYNQPVYANPRPVVYNNYCPPNYYNDFYSPVIYNDYWVRRRYRRFNNCGNLFFSLGFFVTRPYSYYDYARVGYNNPIIYGDDNYYRPPVVEEGGPAEPDAVTAESNVAAAPTQPALNTPEERMLSEVGNYVDKNSVDGRYRINDTAFSNQVWLLELAQAPAVFEIKDGLYSVVAGFEGTLGTSSVPSNVNVEFFVAKTANGFEVRDAWITSANGIARNKLYQSPVFPDVKTWESGKKCPFTGQPMIPIPPAASSEHG